MFFVSLKTRYDINLVAARQHIECISTYRVIYDISKISTEIYIEEKKTFFIIEKCLFFLCEQWDLNPHVINTRPSNVPVCQFQHARLSRQQKELYHFKEFLSTTFFKFFVIFLSLYISHKLIKKTCVYMNKIHK